MDNKIFVLLLLFTVIHSFTSNATSVAQLARKIIDNINRDLADISINVNYTDYNDTSQYYSDTNFDSKGLSGLYQLTRSFVDNVLSEDALGKIFDTNTTSQSDKTHSIKSISESVIRNCANLTATIIFLLVAVLIFPIWGLCYWCCRCCGNCGSKPGSVQITDYRNKIILSLLLIFFIVGLLMFTVGVFGSGEQLYDGVKRLPENLNNTVKDAGTYLNSTVNQLNNLLRMNYDEFSITLIDTLKGSTTIVSDELNNFSNATAMTTMYAFVNNLAEVETTLYTLESETDHLKDYATKLNDELSVIKSNLLETFNTSELAPFTELKNTINAIRTSLNYSSLPNLTDSIISFGQLNLNDLKETVQQGNDALETLKTNINGGLQKGIDDVNNQSEQFGKTIGDNLDNVVSDVTQIQRDLDDSITSGINQLNDYIVDYGGYVHLTLTIISCFLLLVVIGLTFGLVFGWCAGKSDTHQIRKCCSFISLANFNLLCAVILIFIIGFIISILAIAIILIGIIPDKVLCVSLRNLDSSAVIRFIDDYGSDNLVDIDVKPSELLTNCHQNKSIYETFQLSSKFDLDEIQKDFNITEELNKIDVSQVIPDDFTILNEVNMNKLKDLLGFQPNIDSEQFIEVLNITDDYKLNELADQLEAIPVLDPNTKESLKDNSESLRKCNDDIIEPMFNLAHNVTSTALKLDNDLKMNSTSFSDAVETLINEIEEANNILATDGPDKLNNITENYKNAVSNLTNGYVDRVKNRVISEIGYCGPLSLAINATLVSTCDKILIPLNTYGFSLFCTVCIYFCTIIVAIMLLSMFNRYHIHRQNFKTKSKRAYATAPPYPAVPPYCKGGKSFQNKNKPPPSYATKAAQMHEKNKYVWNKRRID